MKLTDIKLLVTEDAADDEFVGGEAPTNQKDLLRALTKKLESAMHQYHVLNYDISHWNKILTRQGYDPSSYPGGYDKGMEDVSNGIAFLYSDDKRDAFVIPNSPDVGTLLRRIHGMQELQANTKTRENKLKKQISSIRKAEATGHVAAKQSNASNAQIPESQVPQVLHPLNKRPFANPYFQSTADRFAGSPAFYSWGPQMVRTYQQLEEIITKEGFEGFTMMYASKVISQTNKWNSADSKIYTEDNAHSNFAVLAARGKIIWRRYDVGGASSYNTLYLNGYTVPVTHFIRGAEQATPEFRGWITDLQKT